MTLHDLNNIAGGDPGLLRAQATRLGGVCDEIAGVVARLRAVSTQGVWDSGAGETFAARVGEVPERLDAVRVRLQVAAGLLPPYATLLADAQGRMRHLDDRYERAQRTVEARDRELETLPPDAPERASLMTERGEAAAESFRLQQAFMRVSEEILADEKRLAARLLDVCPEIDDPTGYDLLEGLSNFGTGPVVDNLAADFVKPLKLAGFAHPIGELGHLLVYDEGSWADVGAAAKMALLGVVKLPMGIGAKADDAVRQSKRTAEVVAAKAGRAGPATGHVGRAARVRGAARANAAQATGQAKVRGKHLAQDGFEYATGIRLVSNMTSDWAALGMAGRVAKGVHVLKYSLAAADTVDGTVRTARTTADTLKKAQREEPEKSVASTPDRCNR